MRNKTMALFMCLMIANVVAIPNVAADRLKAIKENSPFEIQRRESKNKAVHDNFYKDHSILFIYSSRCHHCHQFAPVFKQWLDGQGLTVRVMSLDNRAIGLFPHIEQRDKTLINLAYGDMPHGTPAVFIINEKTKAIYLATYGNLSSNELNFRMSNLVSKIKKFERIA